MGEANVGPSLAKLQGRLELSEAELRKVVVKFPAGLSYGYEANLEPKLNFLCAELRLATAEMAQWVLQNPIVLGASLKQSLAPNIDIWRREVPGIDLRQARLQHGDRFLCCSFARRAKIRVERAKQQGVPAG